MQQLPFTLIRKHYEKLTPLIMANGKFNKSMWVYPYSKYVDFSSLMTPIEESAWSSIRSYGTMPFYPQYPVNNYFLDFANPFLKVAIECDGKEFHKNKQKDLLRDTQLIKLGWSIYRISGADCNRVIDVSNDDLFMEYMREERERLYTLLYTSTVEGLIRALSSHYIPKIINYEEVEYNYLEEQSCDFEAEEESAFYNSLITECLEKRKVKI